MTIPILQTEPVLRLVFRCASPLCGQVDAYPQGPLGSLPSPVHCGRPMSLERGIVLGADPDRPEWGMLRMKKGTTPGGFLFSDRTWPEHWDPAYELWGWRKGPSRVSGERVGWFGLGLLAWEWIAVPGCSPADGVAGTKLGCVEALITVIRGD